MLVVEASVEVIRKVADTPTMEASTSQTMNKLVVRVAPLAHQKDRHRIKNNSITSNHRAWVRHSQLGSDPLI